MSIENLQDIYEDENKLVEKVILDVFAELPDDTKEINVDDLQKKVEGQIYAVSRKDIVDFLKKLDMWNLGTFITGRRGKASRFQAKTFSIDYIGKAAAENEGQSEDSKSLENQKNIEDNEDSKEKQVPQSKTEANTNNQDWENCPMHTFILRQNPIVTLSLPIDITQAEADRLCAYIKTLPVVYQI